MILSFLKNCKDHIYPKIYQKEDFFISGIMKAKKLTNRFTKSFTISVSMRDRSSYLATLKWRME